MQVEKAGVGVAELQPALLLAAAGFPTKTTRAASEEAAARPISVIHNIDCIHISRTINRPLPRA